jgi:hypothetical protein
MESNDFFILMNGKVKAFDQLAADLQTLYREVRDEEINQRFNLWDGEEPATP